MKFIFYGLMIPIAFVLGKVMYAPLAPSLIGSDDAEAEASESVRTIKVKSAAGTIEEVIDLYDVDPKDYPSKITLSEGIILTDKNGLSPLKLDPGSPVKPLVLSGLMLEVTSPLASHLTGKISVHDTDFAEEVAKKRMERRMALMAAEMGNQPAPSPAPAPAPAPMGQIAQNNPQPAPAPTPATAPAPEPAPKPMPEPEPLPAPAAPTSLNAEQIVAAMKANLEGGKIKELDAGKVLKWEAAEDESFDGEDFQVGIATYKEMTILGEKTLQAKALFREGELDKWIHAKTGMEIR